MTRTWIRSACLVLFWALPAFLSAEELVSGKDFDFGPIISRDRALDGSIRYKALGPVWERQTHAGGKSFTATRPVFARVADTNTPQILNEIVWPIATHKTFQNESYLRVITSFSQDYELDRESRYKNHVIPILFQGEASDGSHYFAIFPVGGTIRNFLGKDRILFTLFPLYFRTQVNEFVTHDVLWPVISWGSHDEGSRWRVFPLYGQAQHDGYWKKRFVLWPIWTSVDFQKTEDGGFILFPVTGYSRIGQEKTGWLIPPFFKWLEAPERRAVNCPWPFFQYETGLQEKLYFWPLYGTREKGATKNSFALWPVFNHSETELPHQRTERFSAIPLVFSGKTVDKDKSGGEEVASRYFKLWPLFSYQRNGDASRLRTLALWPTRNMAPVERNFAPFWTLYSRSRSGDSFDTELLWGIYRNKKGEAGERAFSVFPFFSHKAKADPAEFSRWNILAGLFGREVKDGIRRWRVLYFMHFGNKKLESE